MCRSPGCGCASKFLPHAQLLRFQAKLLSENFSTTQARAVIIAKNILYPQALPQTPRRQGLRPVNSILGPLFLSHTGIVLYVHFLVSGNMASMLPYRLLTDEGV